MSQQITKLKEELKGIAPIAKTSSYQQQLKHYFNNDLLKKKFADVLGNDKKANVFISSLLSLANSKIDFQGTDLNSIYTASMTAATLDLPINPNLGFAYVIPYERNSKVGGNWVKTKDAQFQLGYKGYIQLAMRTGAYKSINAAPVYEGQILSRNRLTGEINVNLSFEPNPNSIIVGYVSYFKLLNGFEKFYYMSKSEVENHAREYSQSYKNDKSNSSRWAKSFDAMALKTVLKLLLSKYGILSVEMNTALLSDQATIEIDSEGSVTYEYPDNSPDKYTEAEIVDQSTGEILPNPAFFTADDAAKEGK